MYAETERQDCLMELKAISVSQMDVLETERQGCFMEIKAIPYPSGLQ